MGRIRNMGTSTMRFNEGIVVSGSIDTNYASKEGVAIVATGSVEIAANGTNNQVIRIISNDAQREMVFDSLSTSGGSAQAAQLLGNGSKGLRIDSGNLPVDGSEFRINDGTLYLYRIFDSPNNPNSADKVFIVRSTDFATMRDNIIAAINGTATLSQAKYYMAGSYTGNGDSSNRAAVSAAVNPDFTGGITLTANVAGTGGNSITFLSTMSTLTVLANNTQAFTGGSASGSPTTTQETIASIFTETDDDLVISGSKEVHIRSGEDKAVMILSGTTGGATSPNPSNFTDTNLFVSGTIDSMGTTVKGTSVFGGDLHVSGAAQINTVHVLSNGRVGIGTDTPAYKLEVGGSMSVGEYIHHRNDVGSNTNLRFQEDKITLTAGGTEFLQIEEASTDSFKINKDSSPVETEIYGQNGLALKVNLGGVIINDNSTNKNHFIAKTQNKPNALFIDASTDRVNIGESGPPNENATDVFCFISGSLNSRGTAIKGTTLVGGDLVVSGGIFSNSGVTAPGSNGQILYNNNGVVGATANINYNSSNDRVGIHVASPGFPLHISGETVIRDTTSADLGLYRNQASITSDMELGRFFIGGSEDDTNFYPGVAVIGMATEAWTPGGSEGSEMQFWTTPNGSQHLNQRMTIANDGKVGIGSTNPQSELHVNKQGSGGGQITMANHRSSIEEDHQFGSIAFGGTANDSTYNYGAFINGIATEDWTYGASTPGKLVFKTTPENSTTSLTRVEIDDEGRVFIGQGGSHNDVNLVVSSSAAIETFDGNGGISPVFYFQRYNLSPGIDTGESIGKLSFNCQANDVSNGLHESVVIDAQVDDANSGNRRKGKLTFKTSPGHPTGPLEVARIQDQAFSIGNPTSAARTQYSTDFKAIVSGSVHITGSINGGQDAAIVVDRVKSSQWFAHPADHSLKFLAEYTTSNGLTFNAAQSDVDVRIVTDNNYTAFRSKASSALGLAMIGLNTTGDVQYSNYLLNAGGLYVANNAGLNANDVSSNKGVATFVNRSVTTGSSGINIIIGKGQSHNGISHQDEAGHDNHFIAFYDKDRGTNPTHNPDDVELVGVISGDGSGGIRIVDSFTGTHDTVTQASYARGLIIESTGELWIDKDIAISTCALPKSRLSSSAKSKSVYGVVQSNKLMSGRAKKVPEGWTGVIANAIGEGKVWVTNIGGNIENGDYITTSNIAGYGMLQDDDILHNYTVAKCTQTVDWNSVTDTIDHEGVAYKKYLIACTYHCG